jgi:hypothetical protein
MKYQFTVQKDRSVKISYAGTTWANVKESWEAIKETKS